MEKWTDEDKQALLAFKTVADSDDIRLKECIKSSLLNNRYVCHVLNNKEIEDDENSDPSDYFNVNILPYYLISDTQTNVQNFICYETNFEEVARYNDVIKMGQIIFYILCEKKNLIDEETGIARHDLLAALILDQFNWTNIFGQQYHCVEDKAYTVDKRNGYASRTLIFEGKVPNSIAKTKNGQTRVINSSITYGNLSE